jgi:TetR/AcrR family transcriptional repressor of mexJK operon
MSTDVATAQRASVTACEPLSKQETILDAAIAVFLREGYERSSVDTIALEAGVSKRTIYNHFIDKKGLFLETVNSLRLRAAVDLATAADLLTGERPLKEDLELFGVRLIDAFQTPPYMELKRLLIAEVTHHQELLDACREGVPAKVKDWMTERITRLNGMGLLDVPNPRRAAENYMALISSYLSSRTTYGTSPLDPEGVRELSCEIADFFLRAYLPSRGCN